MKRRKTASKAPLHPQRGQRVKHSSETALPAVKMSFINGYPHFNSKSKTLDL